MLYHYENVEECPIAGIEKVIHGKWTMVIMYLLTEGTFRFSELKRRLPNVTEANLTKDLRLLEKYGLVHREVYPQVPPKVEYSLTEIGKEFETVLEALEKWAIHYQNKIKKNEKYGSFFDCHKIVKTVAKNDDIINGK